MEVILLSDVTKVGKKYDIVSVAPGFARNFLLARGLGEAVTKGNAKRVAELARKREAEKKRQSELLERSLSGVAKLSLALSKKANEEGHLYAGITKEELAELLNKELNVSFTGDHIDLEKPIKAVGEYTIKVIHGTHDAQFTLTVNAEAEE